MPRTGTPKNKNTTENKILSEIGDEREREREKMEFVRDFSAIRMNGNPEQK